jgi:hypothetical protein
MWTDYPPLSRKKAEKPHFTYSLPQLTIPLGTYSVCGQSALVGFTAGFTNGLIFETISNFIPFQENRERPFKEKCKRITANSVYEGVSSAIFDGFFFRQFF